MTNPRKLRGRRNKECSIIENLQRILESVQYNRGSHTKYLKVLQEIFHKNKYDEFFESFMECFFRLFVHDTKGKNPYVSRVVEFLSKFTVSLMDNEENIFITNVIRKILKYHNAISHDIRYRVCEFIKLLLNGLGDNGNIDDNVCDEICIAMQERINDLKPNVRLQAAIAMQRLQDPNNPDDAVISTYLKALKTESNAKIRKTIVQCVGPSMITIPVLIQRCLDRDDTVKLAAFEKFSKIPVRFLRLEQRQFVLRNGFRSKIVPIRKFISETLLVRWLTFYQENYFEFLKALKLDACEEDVKQTVELMEIVLDKFFRMKPLSEMFAIIPITEEKIIPLPRLVLEEASAFPAEEFNSSKELRFENAVYWRCLVKHVHGNKHEDAQEYMEKIAPDLIQFIEYIKSYYEHMKTTTTEWEAMMNNAILTELLKILSVYDMLDEIVRKQTYSMIEKFLTDAIITYDNMEILMQILEKIMPNTEKRTTEICFIISNIREPLVEAKPKKVDTTKRDLKLAPLRVNINIMNEDMDTAVQKQDFQMAEELKNKIKLLKEQMNQIIKDSEETCSSVRVTKNDPQTISKCLDILTALLCSGNITEMTAALRTIMGHFIKPTLLFMDPTFHYKALKCYALFCYLDKKEALESIQLFCTQFLAYRYMPSYNQQTIIVSAESVVDLLMLYGAKIFGEGEYIDNEHEVTRKRSGTRVLYDDSQIEQMPNLPAKASFTDIIEILSEMLDDAETEVREVSGKCLIKIIANNIVKCPSLLSKLIIKWFNPATAKDVKLRQMLGVFFLDYIMRVPGSLSVIEEAFLPTLNAIVNAPRNSPLVEVDMEAMLKFLVELSRPHPSKYDKGLDAHKNIALQLCNEICNKETTKCSTVYLRTLLLLDVPYDDEIILKDLKKQASVMLKLLPEKLHRKLILKYIDTLNGLYNSSIQLTSDNIDTTEQSVDITEGDSVRSSNVLRPSTAFNGKRKRSFGRHSEMRSQTNRTTLNVILERSMESGSVIEDNMEIETPSTESNRTLSPADFANLELSDSNSENEAIEEEPIQKRRSLRKSTKK